MRLIIEVSGGVVRGVCADGKRPVEVTLLDWDDEGEHDTPETEREFRAFAKKTKARITNGDRREFIG